MPDRTAFAELHYGTAPLVLPNAWDVPSALALQAAGFDAVGTTSFGVAASRGTPDGDRTTGDANLALAAALRPLGVMLSFDVEDGYSDDPEEVADYVARLRVNGVNLEDSTSGKLVDPELHAAKIAAVKAISPQLFLNARVDNYWLGEDATVAAALDRAGRYVAAGADGVFVPGTSEPAVITELAGAVGRPLNVLASPSHTVAELAEFGVRRVSTGSLPYRAALAAAVAAARGVRDGDPLPPALAYADVQAGLVGYAAGTS